MVKRLFFNIIFLFLTLTLFAIEYSLSLDKETNISLGDTIRVNLEILNNTRVQVKYPAPKSGVIIREGGRSTSFSIINRVQTSSITFTYLYSFQEAGEYEIGPFEIVSGKDVEITETKQVKVEATQQITSATKKQNNDYFFETIVSKNQAYQNEIIDVDIVFLVAVEVRFNNYSSLDFPGKVWIENIKQGDDYRGQRIINNKYYNEYNIEKKRIFIDEVGEYVIEPAVLNFYTFNRASMFSYYTTPVNLKTSPVAVQIQSLPLEARGLPVGDFNLEVEISNNHQVIQGDPITFHITLSGAGSFHTIKEIPFTTSLPTDIFSTKNEIVRENNIPTKKNWEIILLPKKSGNLIIDFPEFEYFNPGEKKVLQSKVEPININIKKNPQLEQAPVTKSKQTAKLDEVLIKKQLFLPHMNIGKKKNHLQITINFWLLIVSVLLSVLVILVLLGKDLFRKKMKVLFKLRNPLNIFLSELKSINTKATGLSAQLSLVLHLFTNFLISYLKIKDSTSLTFILEQIEERDEVIGKEIKTTIDEINFMLYSGAHLTQERYDAFVTNLQYFAERIYEI